MSVNAQKDVNFGLVVHGCDSMIVGYLNSAADIPNRRQEILRRIADFFEACALGAQQGRTAISLHLGSTNAPPVRSSAQVAFSGASGTVGSTINGVAVTAAHGASDTADATAHAAAIVASSNALVKGLVNACNLAGVVTFVAAAAGDWVEFDGVRMTARSGTPLAPNEFDISGNDTADAASFVAQFNLHPYLRDQAIAENTAGVVTLRQISGTTGKRLVSSSGTTLAVTGVGAATAGSLLAAVATVLVSALMKGKLGNTQTIAASGTGVTIVGGLTRLGGGVGTDNPIATGGEILLFRG